MYMNGKRKVEAKIKKKKEEKNGAVRDNWKIIITHFYECPQVLLSVESSQILNAFACVIRKRFMHYSDTFCAKKTKTLTIMSLSISTVRRNKI